MKGAVGPKISQNSVRLMAGDPVQWISRQWGGKHLVFGLELVFDTHYGHLQNNDSNIDFFLEEKREIIFKKNHSHTVQCSINIRFIIDDCHRCFGSLGEMSLSH